MNYSKRKQNDYKVEVSKHSEHFSVIKDGKKEKALLDIFVVECYFVWQ